MTEKTEGILKRASKGAGTLFDPAQPWDEVRVPAQLMREHKLVEGATVCGPVSEGKRGLELAAVETVCGLGPEEFQQRAPFQRLIAIDPNERFRLAESGDLESAKHYLSRVSEVIHQALKDMRLLVFQMRPPELDTEGLVGALQRRLDAVEKRAGIEARLISDELPTLPDDVVDGLYGIAQEALNNVLKHAEADAVSVTIRSGGASVNFEVVDDGRGFDIEAAHEGGGMGLKNMQERAAQLSGELTIDTAPGQGTKLKVLIGNPTTSQEPTEKSL